MNDVAPSKDEVRFLRKLEAGVDYNEAAMAAGLKVAFDCTLKGWVDRGQITTSGVAMIRPTVTVLRTTSAQPKGEP